MTDHDKHRQRHVELHEALDELVADFIFHMAGARPSNTTVLELIQWSYQQHRPAVGQKEKTMSHIDQLLELIRLWNCLDDGQREDVLKLLRTIVEEKGEDDDEARLQNDHDGD